MSFDVLVSLIAAVTIVATAGLLVGRRLYDFYTTDAVAPLQELVERHSGLRLVGWEPFVKGDWAGCEVRVRVILEHGAAERYNYRTGAITRIEVHVPESGEAASESSPPMSDDELPAPETVAPASVDWESLFAAPMGLVFEMERKVESADELEALLDRLADIADR